MKTTTGYVKNNHQNDELLMFCQMQSRSKSPTVVTMLSVLRACALLGEIDTGKWVHEYVKSNGFDQYVKVNTTLTDMHTKCCSKENSILVF